MRIEGKCHCGNIRFVFHWPGEPSEIPVRACSCTFCTKHGGTYTSNRKAELEAVVDDDSLVSKYRFGTGTADFYLCSRCGVVPFVTSKIQGHLYAVVNVNTFEDVDPSLLVRAVSNFDGESIKSRLDRRERTWIPSVSITQPS